ncbi:MAG: DUF2157 domain-containing protein [Bacteroidota bacterium]
MKEEAQLQELVDAGLISGTQAEDIRQYWASKPSYGNQRLLVVFSLLGALLVGLGVILVVAHNWDKLGRLTKTAFAFIPMLLGQAAVWYTLRRKPDSAAWREGSGVFLLLAVGACLAMVSQIYHLDGELHEFLLTWLWLALPIMYVVNSNLASLFFIAGATWYATDVAYSYPGATPWLYWLFMLLALPYYLRLRKQRPGSNAQVFHDWFWPVSLLICLGTFSNDLPAYMWLAYHLFLIASYILGKYLLQQQKRILSNGWLVVGLLGTIGMLLMQSFRDLWVEIPESWVNTMFLEQEFILFALFQLILLGMLLLLYRKQDMDWLRNPLCYLGILIFAYYGLGWSDHVLGAVAANLLLLRTGIYHILLGTKRDHLGIVNFGLLIVTLQIICRFFDTDLSFAVRGLLFLLLGAGFFAANSYLIRQRKQREI